MARNPVYKGFAVLRQRGSGTTAELGSINGRLGSLCSDDYRYLRVTDTPNAKALMTQGFMS